MILVPDIYYKEEGNYKLRRMAPVEANQLRHSVQAALKNNVPFSEKYIKDLIERVAVNTKSEIISTDVVELFNKVFTSRGDDPKYGGFWVILNGSIGSFAINRWSWVNGKGSAEILFGIPNTSGVNSYYLEKMSPEEQIIPKYESFINFIRSPQKGGMVTIHELMHNAVKGMKRQGVWSHPTGGDVDYANAAADLAGEQRPLYIPTRAVLFRNSRLSLPPHIFITDANAETASGYWGERLNQACNYPSHITNKPTFYKLYKEEAEK